MAAPLTERRTWRRVRLSLVRERAEQPYVVRHAGDVVGLLREFLRDDPRERFAAVYLDARHRPLAVHTAHVGTANSSPVTDVRNSRTTPSSSTTHFVWVPGRHTR